jgi:hypothetical protein
MEPIIPYIGGGGKPLKAKLRRERNKPRIGAEVPAKAEAEIEADCPAGGELVLSH